MTAFTDRHRTDDPPQTVGNIVYPSTYGVPICEVCGERRYQKHAETCPGPPPPYRLHQALGRCWCHRCHTMSEAIALNRALKAASA